VQGWSNGSTHAERDDAARRVRRLRRRARLLPQLRQRRVAGGRERGWMRLKRHCERSEAIHRAAWAAWIASSLSLLAMTAKTMIEPEIIMLEALLRQRSRCSWHRRRGSLAPDLPACRQSLDLHHLRCLALHQSDPRFSTTPARSGKRPANVTAKADVMGKAVGVVESIKD
jgi:hypothetical protein